ncbi:thermonuclease family protein [Pararhodospirillum photometricum]|nr:thermonuclease family protein [Pararhodospirillum photometricum]
MRRVALALTASLFLLPDVAAAADLQGVASVIDGDTLDLHGQRIRMHGLDAPESSQSCQKADGSSYRCGQLSARALADKIGRQTVRCEQKDKDRYGRIVGTCFLGSENLNEWLVRQGLAVAYREYSKAYVPAEIAAREEKLGIWQGSFQMPAEYRKEKKGGGKSEEDEILELIKKLIYLFWK